MGHFYVDHDIDMSYDMAMGVINDPMAWDMSMSWARPSALHGSFLYDLWSFLWSFWSFYDLKWSKIIWPLVIFDQIWSFLNDHFWSFWWFFINFDEISSFLMIFIIFLMIFIIRPLRAWFLSSFFMMIFHHFWWNFINFWWFFINFWWIFIKIFISFLPIFSFNKNRAARSIL